MSSESGFAMAELTAGQLNALVKKVGGKDKVLEILRGDVEFAIRQPDLLRRVSTIQVNGVDKFVASDHLKVANVGWVSDNFKKFFLDNIEENVADTTVAIYRLEQSSLDAPIMAKLGDRTEINLAHLFELLKKQSMGEAGILLTNGYANIAYVKGSDGNVWAVNASWDSAHGCWGVEAVSVEGPGRWGGGRQVLSRDS